MDATVTPADIRFPTDMSLLNEAREKTESVIDTFRLSKKPMRARAGGAS